MPPVRGRGAARAQFGLSRSTANSISPSVGARSARTKFSLFFVIRFSKLEYTPASRARKLVLPTADGPELQRAVEATDIQRFHTIGVFRWSRTFPRSPQERPPGTSWPGSPQLRSGLPRPLRQISYTLRLPSSSFFASNDPATLPTARR